jgi:hypothetical protein
MLSKILLKRLTFKNIIIFIFLYKISELSFVKISQETAINILKEIGYVLNFNIFYKYFAETPKF